MLKDCINSEMYSLGKYIRASLCMHTIYPIQYARAQIHEQKLILPKLRQLLVPLALTMLGRKKQLWPSLLLKSNWCHASMAAQELKEEVGDRRVILTLKRIRLKAVIREQ